MLTWPASAMQEAFMTIGARRPGFTTGAGCTLSAAVRMTGPLDATQLDKAFDDLVARNDVLRSTMSHDGTRWLQQVHSHRRVALERVEPGGRGPAELARTWAAASMPVDEPPLARAFLARLGPDDHLLGLAFHHLHADPRSLILAVRELAVAYEGRLAGCRIDPLPIQFGAYIHARAAVPPTANQRRAWIDTFAGVRSMGYTCDRDRGTAGTPATTTFQAQVLTSEAARILERWALRRRTTLFAALVTGFSLALAEHVVHRDLLITTVFERRDRPETRTMIGPFLHPSLLRVKVPRHSTWDTLTPQVRDMTVAAYDNTQVPTTEVFAAHPELPRLYAQPGAKCVFEYLPAYGRAEPVSFGAAAGVVLEQGSAPGPSTEVGMMFRLRRTDAGNVMARVAYDSRDQSESTVRAVFKDFVARLAEPVATGHVPS